jgi:hypothetical protein
VVNIARARRGAEGRQHLDDRAWRRRPPRPTPTSTGRCRRRSCWGRRDGAAAAGPGAVRSAGPGPDARAVDSLNVSVAAGVVLYEAVRQRIGQSMVRLT